MSSVPHGFRQQDSHRWVTPLGRQWRGWYEVLEPGTDDSVDPPVHMRVGLAPDGRLVCTGVLVGALADGEGQDGEVTARAVHDLKVGQLVSELASYRAPKARPTNFAEALMQRKAQAMLGAAEAATPRPRVRPGPKGHPLEFYEGVADDYRMACQEAPHGAMEWLAEYRGYSKVQMERLVREARRLGKEAADAGRMKEARRLLGPALRGKAGEGPIEDTTKGSKR